MKETGNRGQGTGRLAALLLLLSCSLFPVSCAKHKKPDAPKAKKDDPLPISKVAVGAGDTLVYATKDPDSLPSFSLAWDAGGFDLGKGGVDTGELTKPKGQIFQKGKPVSDYRADAGEARRRDARLTMRGDVTLRSLDGKGTLKSPQMEYRGDAKLLRALGGVVATGPFGTLSGVPEMWATPDLNLIGTPDMVSQKLKIPALVALAATAATGSPRLQKGQTFDFENQQSVLAENQKGGGVRLTLRPKPGGPLVVRLLTRGIVVESAGTVVIDLTPGSRKDVRHLTTSGRVHVVQKNDDGTTTLDGHDAVYDWDGKAPTADLDLPGPVTIVQTGKVKNRAGALFERTTATKGDRGEAVLLNDPKGDANALRRATLVGHVAIDVSPVDGESFSGVGERLVYVPGAETSNVELVGGTTITQLAKDADSSRTLVAKGARARATLLAKPPADTNPLKTATLEGGVTLDVSGSNGETFRGKGDQVVYTGEANGRARAVMTGALEFFGAAKDYTGDIKDADTATMILGKEGWQSVETTNSGKPIHAHIDLKEAAPKATAGKGKKKGGKP